MPLVVAFGSVRRIREVDLGIGVGPSDSAAVVVENQCVAIGVVIVDFDQVADRALERGRAVEQICIGTIVTPSLRPLIPLKGIT